MRPLPLVPEDLRGPRPRASTFLFRGAAAHVRGASRNVSAEAAACQLFGRDAELILRAATVPATTTGTGWAAEIAPHVVLELVADITSQSAAADIIGRGLKVDLSGVASLRVPGRVLNASQAGSWVAEGMPAPVRALNFANVTSLEPRTLEVIATYTVEMAESSNLEAIARQTISEASGLALDAALFSTAADDGVHPGGILHNVPPLTPTAGGGLAALQEDLANLFAALAANGAGKNAVLVCAVPQATTLKLTAGPKFDTPIISSTGLASGTVIAVEVGSFVSGFDAVPKFSTSTAAVIHEEATAPLPLVDGAGTLAAPQRSLFQTDTIGLKMILQAAWGMRAVGHVQYIPAATW